MKPASVQKFLKLFGCKVPTAQQRGGWIVSDCPMGPWKHEQGKSNPTAFGVKKEEGDPFANCLSCGWHGKLSDLIIEVRMLNKQADHKKVDWNTALAMIEEAEMTAELDLDTPGIEEMLFGPKPQPHPFPEDWLASFPSWMTAQWAVDYLAGRQVSSALAIQLDLRADMVQRRVCFPIRDAHGTLYGLHGRAVDKDAKLRYRMYTHKLRNNPKFWLGEAWVDPNRPIVVVEGPFDLISVMRVYDNVVSPLFVNPSLEKLRRMTDCLEWITLYDRGKGGDVGRKKVEQAMSKDHVVTHLLPPEGYKDPGEMGLKALEELLSPYVGLTY